MDCHEAILAPPLQRLAVVRVEEIDAVGALDGAAAVLHHSPAVSGHIHSCAKRVVTRIGRDGPISGQDSPREQDLEWDAPRAGEAVARKQTSLWHAGHGATGSLPGVGLAPAAPLAHILVPDIELQVFPAPPLPITAGPAGAICRCVNFPDLRTRAGR